MDLNREFEGRTAFVTGAASGIGRETARLFAHRGARVACVDIVLPGCAETVSEIERSGGEALSIEADLSRPEGARHAMKAALARFGRIDHAFNNAGVVGSHEDPFDEQRVEHTIAVNLLGVHWCIKHQVPAMIRQGGGTIVNTASIAGISGAVGALDYTAAKHGVVGLTGAVARRFGPQGVRCNAVCPGIIQTAMADEVEGDDAKREAIFARLSPITGKLGTPRDIAEAVLFLSSERAGFIHGVALPVDGGFTI
ncbi:SDR family NAD(P)-dependent oxidoreductase [Novosphingobium pentaromativorans]|uniref:Short-chain dehydrogenase/reductase SDR n=1 Tax=Novosphingobium pentaromativorans US6-1 TaxID=1088721 RepID=G6ECH8_9SPHN|nr:glucose 1-dehydrogenase [Novosphingobium pentaromativorans]EHJ60889.1 hypothetical protein NSU_2049 [Novosphingobium pentaromativorans US6-1]